MSALCDPDVLYFAIALGAFVGGSVCATVTAWLAPCPKPCGATKMRYNAPVVESRRFRSCPCCGTMEHAAPRELWVCGACELEL